MNSQPLDDLFWRDEILQILFWYIGEGFGKSVTPADLQPFLNQEIGFLTSHMEQMVEEGYLEYYDGPDPGRYQFTQMGHREGARRFADEFSGLTGQAHMECGPDCPHCKGVPRDRCVHCAPEPERATAA